MPADRIHQVKTPQSCKAGIRQLTGCEGGPVLAPEQVDMVAHAGEAHKHWPQQAMGRVCSRPLCQLWWVRNQRRQLHGITRQHSKSAWTHIYLVTGAIPILVETQMGLFPPSVKARSLIGGVL